MNTATTPPASPPASAALAARRRLLAAGATLIGMPALWTARRANAQGAALRPTPAQTEGPFYPVAIPADHDNDLLQSGTLRYAAGGQPGWLDGTLVDTRGRPLAGASIEIWQCDQDGHYHHPGDGGRAEPSFQGFGRTMADGEGRWRFHTLRPAPYTGRTPHIHLKVKADGRELLTTQIYMAGAPGNARDGLWRRLSDEERAALTRDFAPQADKGWRAHFPVVVAT